MFATVSTSLQSSLSIKKFFFIQAQWVLVDWPEDSMSVVKHTSVVHPLPPKLLKGDECQVKVRKKKFTGKFVDKGECCLAYTCTLIFIINEDTHLFPQQEKSVSLEKSKSSV